MIALRSIIFNIAFFTWTAVLATIGLPLLLLPAGATYAFASVWIRAAFSMLAILCGLDHEVRGRPPAPGEHVILAVKHQSAFETMVFNLLVQRPAFVLKRELFFIPLFGWLLWRCGMIAIDRASGAKAILSMVRQAQAALARGQTLVIFPEGTRRAPGAPPQYQPGVAALYNRLKVPVIPVALNTGSFWGRRSFIKHPGRMVIEFLEPIAPGLDRAAFMATLEERIETASERLRAEASLIVDKSVDNSPATAH